MARRPSGELAPIYRVDLLEHRMNAAKEAAVLNVLRRWRRGAVGLAQEQWRLFFGEGRFDKNHPDKSLEGACGRSILALTRGGRLISAPLHAQVFIRRSAMAA